MKICYGVEMKALKEKLPGYTAQIIKKTAELANVIDRDDQLVIIESKTEAAQLAAFYQEKDILENQFTLFRLEQVEMTDLFFDYGFSSTSNHAYLYEETSLPFIIKNGDLKQIEMALLQIEEHLIAKETNDQIFYYINRHQKELIEKYAQAYNITISFPYDDENASRQTL
ncbi:hypothetical protein [Bacillus taeanensis]|uniref:Uncharacterized protein n=1 Tax=Bacillus taeanensis TaxID=273032 RepID=A0A366XVZ5_9BACI|nr:hypothetical protein [Bacillus taeanensis]RBW70570.1 hypothetical protein DS031_06010 [Bacillus taeanensis]